MYIRTRTRMSDYDVNKEKMIEKIIEKEIKMIVTIEDVVKKIKEEMKENKESITNNVYNCKGRNI